MLVTLAPQLSGWTQRLLAEALSFDHTAVASTGGGGWPMSVFLTPDLKPFFGGTYFPPDDRYGRPGFPKVLQQRSEAWQKDQENVVKAANNAIEALKEYSEKHVQRTDPARIAAAIHDALVVQPARARARERPAAALPTVDLSWTTADLVLGGISLLVRNLAE